MSTLNLPDGWFEYLDNASGKVGNFHILIPLTPEKNEIISFNHLVIGIGERHHRQELTVYFIFFPVSHIFSTQPQTRRLGTAQQSRRLLSQKKLLKLRL